TAAKDPGKRRASAANTRTTRRLEISASAQAPAAPPSTDPHDLNGVGNVWSYRPNCTQLPATPRLALVRGSWITVGQSQWWVGACYRRSPAPRCNPPRAFDPTAPEFRRLRPSSSYRSCSQALRQHE